MDEQHEDVWCKLQIAYNNCTNNMYIDEVLNQILNKIELFVNKKGCNPDYIIMNRKNFIFLKYHNCNIPTKKAWIVTIDGIRILIDENLDDNVIKIVGEI